MSNTQEVAIALQDWYDWTLAGAPKDNPYEFTRGAGLCFNIRHYPRFANSWTGKVSTLRLMLAEDGLVGEYPFNSNSVIDYNQDYATRSHHLNEKRLAWVLKTIESYGGG